MAYNNFSYPLLSYPIIADPKREVANLYGMLDPDAKDAKGIPLTCRFDYYTIWPPLPCVLYSELCSSVKQIFL